MRQFALLGHPLGHSFSAAYFNNKFAQERIDAKYENLDLPDIQNIRQFIADTPNLSGLNVTIPYKKAIIQYLDNLSPRAATIGAVNTIHISRRGNTLQLTGHNTDSPAFSETIQQHIQPHHKCALLLGATGGAAQAVKYALQQLGITILPVSRTPQSGGITYQQISPEVMQQAYIIINTTPLGMYPNIERYPPIPYQYITPLHLCYDLIYNPEETEFLRLAAQQGATIINGLPMLYRQAELAWDIWNH